MRRLFLVLICSTFVILLIRNRSSIESTETFIMHYAKSYSQSDPNPDESSACSKNVTQAPSHMHKYVTFTCNNPGRLGNQFWPLFAGWAIGKSLNRRLYLNGCNNRTMELFRHIQWIFPRVAGIYEIMKPKGEKVVPFAYVGKKRAIQGYDDPLIYSNRTEKYLRADIFYAQNARFIYPHRQELHELLEFGGEITEKGEAIMNKLKLNPENVLCAHIRQSDFAKWKWSRTYEDVTATVRYVAKMKPNRTLLVMGDDQTFMKKLVAELVKSGDVAKNSLQSTYSRAEDLYLARRVCRTFVHTSEGSTFGFWLAFVAGPDSKIYYLNEDRPKIPQFDSQFPLPWTPINVLNGTVVW